MVVIGEHEKTETERVGVSVAMLSCIWQIPSSDLFRVIDYPAWRFLLCLSIPQGNCRDNISKKPRLLLNPF
jgi:hypothetical protein